MKKTIDVWKKVPVILYLPTLRGGLPCNSNLLEEYAEKRKERIRTQLELKKPGIRGQVDAQRTSENLEAITGEPVAARNLDQIAAEEEATWPVSEVDKMTLGFQGDEQGLFVRSGAMRHHFKDCAKTLGKRMASVHDIGAFAAKVSTSLYVVGPEHRDRIYLQRANTGETITEPDGHEDRTMSVMTPQGPRTCFQRVQEVQDVQLRFWLYLYTNGVVQEPQLRELLTYGSVHGSFQDRSLGHGQYTKACYLWGEKDWVDVDGFAVETFPDR